MSESVGVVVVGAGPVGLLAAIELALGGVRVLILERLERPSLTIKALGVGPLGGEALQRRGMAAALAAAEARNFAALQASGMDVRARFAKGTGHFAGLSLLRRDAQDEPDRRMRLVTQQDLEALMGEQADVLGIEIRRGVEVVGLMQDRQGVDVSFRSAARVGHVRCAFLVGCDGGRSTVRKLAGFAFPGTPPTMTMMQAVGDIDHPDRLGPPGWRRTATGVYAHGPFPRRFFMLDFSGPPKDRQAPVTREEAEAMLRRISGADVRVTGLDVANRWTDNTRLVDAYRHGRVFLAGDAAHVHSPFGGQGLSLGLCDVANLGWKLAAVLRHGAPEVLLETYGSERRPVAEAVLANTLAQTALMRPDPQSGAVRDLLATLLGFDDVNRLIGGLMSGTAVRYDLGEETGRVGRLLGDQALDTYAGPASLYEAMQGGSGVLLDASPDGAASTLAAALTSRVRAVRVASGPSMLIRPDACLAWMGEDGATEGLEEALRRWFVKASTGSVAPTAAAA